MARPIKFRFTMINTNALFGRALRDCTIDTVYEGTFYDKGEVTPYVDQAIHDTIIFTDNVGDTVDKFLLPQDCTIEEVTACHLH